jgi:hypothetical protein
LRSSVTFSETFAELTTPTAHHSKDSFQFTKERTPMIRKIFSLSLTLIALSVATFAQREEKNLDCNNQWNNRGRDWFNSCRMQEMTLPANGGLFTVDGRGNGSVRVKGWEKNEIFVRAQLQGFGKSQASADSYLEQTRVIVSDSTVRGEGPQVRGSGGWSVSYEVFVPRRSDLSLKGSNGSLSVSDVAGNIELNTSNGSVNLRNVAGNVRGGTVNGSINVELEGSSWQGEGLDLHTTNGSVRLILPDGYNAHFAGRTVNGGMNFDFPVTVVGKIERNINTNLGNGGAPIRVQTTNGSVSLKRKQ